MDNYKTLPFFRPQDFIRFSNLEDTGTLVSPVRTGGKCIADFQEIC